jgi:hypothetical protein
MRPTGKQLAAIVGVSALSIGLVIGGGVAANAATVSVRSALAQHSTHDSAVTPTPSPTEHPRGHDANDNDANDDNGHDAAGHDANDDNNHDATGTEHHHGGNGSGHSDAPRPAPAPSSGHDDSGHDGSGHDNGDDNGHHGGDN